MRSIIFLVIGKIVNGIFIPILRWASADKAKAPAAVAEYIEPSETLNASVIQMAQKDREEYLAANPEAFQAELNGLLEALRTEAINGAMQGFMVTLLQQGYPADECLRRSSANTIHLGMFLQKRMGAN